MRRTYGFAAAVICISLFLGGCKGVTKEQKEYRESGIALMESGDFAGAVEKFDLAVADASRVSDFELDVLKYRAEAEYRLQDYAAASYTYEMLYKLDGKEPEYLYMDALCLAKNDNSILASTKLEEARAADEKAEKPGYAEAMTALSACYRRGGQLEEAAALDLELIQSGKATSGIYNRLALSSMEEEDYSRALEYIGLGQALSDGEADRELKFNEAVCYEKQGEFAKALDCFKSYVSTYGSDEDVAHEIAFLETR